MMKLALPLSGDVTQAINPVSWWVRSAGQIGLINISLGATPAPDIEERVLDEIGTYGRQIGRLGDAIDVLISCLDRNSLSPEQSAAIAAFETQLAEVRRIKADEGRAGPGSLSRPPARVLTAIS